MRNSTGRILRVCLRLLFYGGIGVVLTLLIGFVLFLERRPDLAVWHLAELDEEFTRDSPEDTLAEYLALEERLFAEFDDEVYGRVTPQAGSVNRFAQGSLSDPRRWPTNWNRTFVMPTDAPAATVLLLHGLSDSPYSLRALGERLHASGAYVLGLRLPGHGTAPSGLVEVRWEDMAAAVRLAVAHLAEVAGDAPLYIVGYSTGAALAVNYALDGLRDAGASRPAGLVLISPSIGVTSAAALAVWQARLGHWLGLEKLAWNDILPEYDPFKYNSFAVNAGDLSHRLTRRIQRQLDELEGTAALNRMPPVLSFASVVDATVSTPALVSHLFDRLAPSVHHLVLFDINRRAGIEPLLAWQPAPVLENLQEDVDRTYSLEVIGNATPDTRTVVLRSRQAGSSEVAQESLDLAWPDDVFSLSHVALPFPPDDPLYGGVPGAANPGVHLGRVAWRGERGVLHVSPSMMLRLRWNPFYAYLEGRTLGFMGLDKPAE